MKREPVRQPRLYLRFPEVPQPGSTCVSASRRGQQEGSFRVSSSRASANTGLLGEGGAAFFLPGIGLLRGVRGSRRWRAPELGFGDVGRAGGLGFGMSRSGWRLGSVCRLLTKCSLESENLLRKIQVVWERVVIEEISGWFGEIVL